MSRFAARKPFHPGGAFVAIRAFTVNGEAKKPGDPVDISQLGERRAAQLYDMKRIDYAPDGVAQIAPTAPAKAEQPAVNGQPATDAPAAPYTMKYAGFGGWKITGPDGEVVEEGISRKEDAEAKLQALLAGV